MKHWNKPLALLLAMAMALSMAVTAFAEESKSNEEGIMPINEEEGAVPINDDKDDENKDEDKDADADTDKDADADADKDEDKEPDAADVADMSYTDVTDKNWYYSAVAYATAKNLIDGKDETTFAPGEEMTRQALAVALYRLAGSPEVTAENPFADVADDAAYKNAVVWAYSKGIVTGVDATTFNPDSPIQRQAIAAMLARYAGVDTKEEGDLSAFTDADAIQSYAKAPLSWAVEKGLIKGNDKGAVEPRGNATRAQVAVILERFAPLVEDVSTAGTAGDAAQPDESSEPDSKSDAADADKKDDAADKDNASDKDTAPAEGEGDAADTSTDKKDA